MWSHIPHEAHLRSRLLFSLRVCLQRNHRPFSTTMTDELSSSATGPISEGDGTAPVSTDEVSPMGKSDTWEITTGKTGYETGGSGTEADPKLLSRITDIYEDRKRRSAAANALTSQS